MENLSVSIEVIKATNNTVEPYWPMLFAKYLGEKDIAELLLKPSCGAAAPAAGTECWCRSDV